MKITADWVTIGWSNMTVGKNYRILVIDASQVLVSDDNGILKWFSNIDVTTTWTNVVITDNSTTSVQLYP